MTPEIQTLCQWLAAELSFDRYATMTPLLTAALKSVREEALGGACPGSPPKATDKRHLYRCLRCHTEPALKGTPATTPAPRHDEVWPAFHHLWTKAVGTPDYVKREWQALEAMLGIATYSPTPAAGPRKCEECAAVEARFKAGLEWPRGGGMFCTRSRPVPREGDHVTHYKISLEVLRKAGLKEDGFCTFCGVDIRHSTNPEEEARHIPPCDGGDCDKLVVDCPTCLLIYNTIADDAFGSKGN